MEQFCKHQLVRVRGGVIAVLYEIHWKGLLRPSWKREMDLQHSRQHILQYWQGLPDQQRSANHRYRAMRIDSAMRELARNKGRRYVPSTYVLVSRATWARHLASSPLPVGAFLWYNAKHGIWWLGKSPDIFLNIRSTSSDFSTTPGRSRSIALSDSRYTTSNDAVRT